MHYARDSASRALTALAFAACIVPGSAAPEPLFPRILSAAPEQQLDPPPDDASPFPSPPPRTPSVSWATALGPIEVENANTAVRTTVRLYTDDGEIDTEALDLFARTVSEKGHKSPISPRLVQLAVRSAYMLGSRSIVVISAYRRSKPGTGGYHATGEALDFKLRGVDARKLAAHLRSYPRVGVGVYTHPQTQYVHLDVREASYHWLDGSPPGRTWREAQLPDPNRAKRDDAYVPEMDLPRAHVD
jgi:uncharacterized protein YcbK (DUF882 family)